MPEQNHLLNSLTPEDFALLRDRLEPVDLPFRFKVEIPDRPISHAYFPADGIVSVVAAGARDQTIEVGIIGREGMTGIAVLLGTTRSPNLMNVQIAGHGFRIATDDLLAALAESRSLHNALLAYVQAFLIQASQTALANGRAKLETRLARWLLMAHDRVSGNELALTHEFLSLMLGVHRPGVTIALQQFEARGILEAHRGALIIKDRALLRAFADGIYGVSEAELERLTGWRPLHNSEAAMT